ncbi:MAG: type II toxin-antitoxin system RelE/ParE family toxin [Candidatus Omnitrophica bacterium]|nr:type II toxin-antitoxin system RelE/ParE family toxin [Candidatus Omnitrophota bacterium]
MIYKIEFALRAIKALAQLQKSQPAIASRVINAINVLAHNPFCGKALRADLRGYYSLRIGIYRAIYRIDQDRIVIQVVRVGHRRDGYR